MYRIKALAILTTFTVFLALVLSCSDKPTDPIIPKEYKIVYTVSPDGTGPIYLTDSTTNDILPKLSSDGSKITYAKHDDSVSNLYIMNIDGIEKTALTNNITYGYVH